MNSNDNIRAIVILEILGRPPEHLKETLENLTKSIGEEKGIFIVEKKVSEPSPLKEKNDFYTSFAEIEIEIENLFSLVFLMFKYMPAHIDILTPEKISMTNTEWNDILNELTRRLHGYDEVARVLMTEKAMMQKKIEELIGKGKNNKKTKKNKKNS